MLEIKDISCVRGDRPLFSGLSFTVAPGSLHRVLGPNGTGKTSLLRMISGLSTPADGEVLWNGTSIYRLREDFYSHVLYFGHAPAIKDELTAEENLTVAATLSGAVVTQADVRKALALIGLKGREELPARVLSQGQRRRVNLARMLLPVTPSLWVLDEPFSALDVAAVDQLRELIERHVSAGGMVVFTTHQDAPWTLPVAAVSLEKRRQARC